MGATLIFWRKSRSSGSHFQHINYEINRIPLLHHKERIDKKTKLVINDGLRKKKSNNSMQNQEGQRVHFQQLHLHQVY